MLELSVTPWRHEMSDATRRRQLGEWVASGLRRALRPDDETSQSSFLSDTPLPPVTLPSRDPPSPTPSRFSTEPLPLSCSDIYNLNRNIFVAREDSRNITVPREAVDIFERDIKGRLSKDLEEARKKVERSVVRGASLRRADDWIFGEPMIRMSGMATGGATGCVTLSPTIWVRCSRRYHRQVKKALLHPFLDWTRSTEFGSIMIGDAAKLLARSKLSESDDITLRDDGIELDASTKLYLDVDKDAIKSSSNGILCRATVARHGTIPAQRHSTIGGIIYINGRPYGITTAHAMFDHVWDEANKGFNFDSPRPSYESSRDDYSQSGTVSSRPSEDYGCYAQFRMKPSVPAPNPSEVRRWAPASIGCVANFLSLQLDSTSGTDGERTTIRVDAAAKSDIALISLGDKRHGKQNVYDSSRGSAFVNTLAEEEDLQYGPVEVILGKGAVVSGTLLSEGNCLTTLGVPIPTRVVGLDTTLAPGASGAWVVREGKLLGVIIAGYDNEPLAHMISAPQLLASLHSLVPNCTVSLVRPPAADAEENVHQEPNPKAPTTRAGYVSEGTTADLESTATMGNSSASPKGRISSRLAARGGTHLPKRYKPGAWPVVFAHPRDINMDAENEPYLDFCRRHGYFDEESEDSDDSVESEGSDATDDSWRAERDFQSHGAPAWDEWDNNPAEEDSVALFMRGCEPTDERDQKSMNEEKRVVSFCRLTEYLGPVEDKSKRVSILMDMDEMADETSLLPLARKSLFPTAEQLHEKLHEPRFPSAADSSRRGQARKGVERRIVYIPNLEATVMRILAASAPRSHRQALVSLFYHHVKPSPSVRVDITLRGLRTYTFHFHVPFFVLREHSKLRMDPRRNPDGSPLRCSRDLGFLSVPGGEGKKQCLYEAQTSIVLTGLSDRFWTAYGVTDDYYERRGQDSIKRHHRESKQCPAQRDPITRKISSPQGRYLDARAYFLACVEARSRQILREWQYIVVMLNDFYTNSCNEGRYSSKKVAGLETRDEGIRMLTRLVARLFETTQAWEVFEQCHMSFFQPDPELSTDDPDTFTTESEAMLEVLSAIRCTFSELGSLLRHLEELKKHQIDAHRRTSQLHELEAQRSVEKIRSLTLLTMVFSPMSLVAAVFSMQPGILPFHTTLWTFLLSIGILSIAYMAVHTLISKWEEWIPVFLHAISKMSTMLCPPEAASKPSVAEMAEEIPTPTAMEVSEPLPQPRRAQPLFFSHLMSRRQGEDVMLPKYERVSDDSCPV
ncbi:hypothetical protein QBC34DRAFT_224960 [Podospora aff. communis PSN243]|uniref:Uncharacterized protein n=1 Tax=Podospora aff. communis PSN243 TaxID=3040156 RepID=A0AAV9FZH5_9PEZI|nr:hypothetical protein QBC34DRAFT_224960 [Podospora aff. communis PSN243]